MKLEEFVENFASQFEDTDASEINASTAFQELDEWSSLMVMTVIAMAKTDYEKTITGTEIRHCNTVEDLFKLVEAK